MKDIDLTALGVTEIDDIQMSEKSGGFWYIMAAVYLFDNRDRIYDGICDGIHDLF